MKKSLLFIIVALGAITALAMVAIGDMATLEDTEMAEITGQTGFSLDVSIEATAGFLGLYDTDGMYPQTGAAYKGCLTLGSFWANGGSSNTPLTATDWTIDAGTGPGGSYWQIGFGKLTAGENSGLGFDQVKIGTLPDRGFNVNSISITNVDMFGTTFRIQGT